MSFEDLDILFLVLSNHKLDYDTFDDELIVNKISYKISEYQKVDKLVLRIKQDNNIC